MKNGLTVKTLLIELGLASGATKFKSISDIDVFHLFVIVRIFSIENVQNVEDYNNY